jgi:hypothetical protein
MTNAIHDIGRKNNLPVLNLAKIKLRWRLRRIVLLMMILGKGGIEVGTGRMRGRNTASMKDGRGIRVSVSDSKLKVTRSGHAVSYGYLLTSSAG